MLILPPGIQLGLSWTSVPSLAMCRPLSATLADGMNADRDFGGWLIGSTAFCWRLLSLLFHPHFLLCWAKRQWNDSWPAQEAQEEKKSFVLFKPLLFFFSLMRGVRRIEWQVYFCHSKWNRTKYFSSQLIWPCIIIKLCHPDTDFPLMVNFWDHPTCSLFLSSFVYGQNFCKWGKGEASGTQWLGWLFLMQLLLDFSKNV